MRSMVVFLAWGVMMGAGMAKFAAPLEEPAPFRRDRVPLDVETMTSLSRQLTMLASAAERSSPEQERVVSQMLALALALDPANRGARELTDELAAGAGSEAELDAEGRQRVLNRVWNLQGWLVSDQAGEDGQVLGRCLTDVLGVLDPTHPRVEKEAVGKWAGWVPDLAAFQDPTKNPEEDTAMVDEGGEDPMEEDGKEEPAVPVALSLVESPVMIWNAEDGAWRVSKVASALRDPEEKQEGEEGRRLFVATDRPPRNDAGVRWDLVEKQARTILPRRGQPLPEGFSVRVKVNGGAVRVSTRRSDMLVSTLLVHVDAMRLGRHPEALMLVRVESDGRLSIPPRLWEMLKDLGKEPEGYRVIVPRAAADLLTGMLVMERSGELLKHEFLLADTFEELCQLAEAGGRTGAGGGDPGEIDKILSSSELSKESQAALKGFGEIQRVSQGKALGTFLSHPSTQARLKEVVTGMPSHASARLLAMQGSGNRPRFMPAAALAREIREAVRPLQELNLAGDLRELKERDVERVHAQTRAQLDPLIQLIDIRDRDLLRRAVSTVDGLRALERTFRQRDPERQNEQQAKQRENAYLIYDGWVVLLEDLTKIAGDRQDEILPPKREIRPGP